MNLEKVVPDAPASATVGSSTTVVLAAAAAVRFGYFINDANEPIYLGLGHPAVLNKGIRINSSGGSYSSNETPFRIPPGQAINAICLSGGQNLCIQTYSHQST